VSLGALIQGALLYIRGSRAGPGVLKPDLAGLGGTGQGSNPDLVWFSLVGLDWWLGLVAGPGMRMDQFWLAKNGQQRYLFIFTS